MYNNSGQTNRTPKCLCPSRQVLQQRSGSVFSCLKESSLVVHVRGQFWSNIIVLIDFDDSKYKRVDLQLTLSFLNNFKRVKEWINFLPIIFHIVFFSFFFVKQSSIQLTVYIFVSRLLTVYIFVPSHALTYLHVTEYLTVNTYLIIEKTT